MSASWISIVQARAEFASLVSRAEAGEEIIITRNGKPVARLMASTQKPIVYGDLAGLWIDTDLSLPDSLINEFLARRSSRPSCSPQWLRAEPGSHQPLPLSSWIAIALGGVLKAMEDAMKSALRHWVAWVAIGLSLATSHGAAAADGADQGAVESTISQQMDAFKRDDAAAAYAFAAPGIKALFPDAGTFMAMVRNKYAPVYRPKDVAFGELTAGEEGVTQSVTIIDSDGEAWTALYSLAKGADGNWQITGCVLLKRPQTST